MRPCWLVTALLLTAAPLGAQTHDIVLRGGRVMDPETRLDAIRDVGISAGKITAVSAIPLAGDRVIDASGLVVAPGFIDLHQHRFDEEGLRLKAFDGVTLALELEGGVPDLGRFLGHWAGRAPIHLGAAACHLCARVQAWGDDLPESVYGPHTTIADPPSDAPVIAAAAGPEQLERLLTALRRQLDQGALGIGLGLEYTPGATREEVVALFRLAADYARPVYAHIRAAGPAEPGSSIESMLEVLGAAAVSGAPLHVVHVNSMCMAQAPQCLELIAGARARGLDVTAEAYPWGAFSTLLGSAVFSPGWRERNAMDYGDLELPGNGERLTEARFHELRGSAEPVIVLGHLNPPEVYDAVMRHPLVMVASDGLPGHPRNAGSFARVLARYVREQGSLTLMEALEKMTLMPARRLEAASPGARHKGRLQVAADADIVVFDPAAMADQATYADADRPSAGVRYLLVAGEPVIDAGHWREAVRPGQAFTAPPSSP